MGEPPPILFVFCFYKGIQRPEPTNRPNNLTHSNPIQIEKTSSIIISKSCAFWGTSIEVEGKRKLNKSREVRFNKK